MDAVISLALTLLQTLVPQLGTANGALITKIISGLVALVPVLVKEYQDLVPMVKNVISVLQGNGNVTPEQLAELAALEVQIDAAFEAAAAKAEAEDAAG